MSSPPLFDAAPNVSPVPSAVPRAAAADATPDADTGSQSGVARTQSLYRKYRPQSFDADELVGQEHVVRTLHNAIALNRVAHAYLFCGPRGTGKTTTARLLAKAVNCLAPEPRARPCNACANCLAISRNATTDVIEIDAASNRGIDDIRDLRERVKYAPTQLSTKFYIIDEAHQITGPAANAFLKTLEEPPGHTKFVLATTDPEELLPTIVSRCQRFDFRRIGLEATVARLRSVAIAEGLTVDDEALAVIARHATGSLRDALGLLDQLAVYRDDDGPHGDKAVTADTVRALLGVSRNDRVETLAAALADRDAGLALGTVNAAVEAGEDPRQLNRQLVAYLRVLLHQRAGGSLDADARARDLAARFDLLDLADLARRFGEIDYKIKHSSYAHLPLEVALVGAALRGTAPVGQARHLPAQTTTIDAAPVASDANGPVDGERDPNGSDPERDLLRQPPTTALRDRVRGTGSRPAARAAGTEPSGATVRPPLAVVPEPTSSTLHAAVADDPVPAIAPRPTAVPSAPSAGLDVERLVDLWPRIRQDVKAVNRRIEALLSSIDPVAVNRDRITLAAAYEFHRSRLNTDEVRTVVEDAIERLLGSPVRVTCVLRGELTPAAVAPSPAAQTVAPPSFAPPDQDDLPPPRATVRSLRESGPVDGPELEPPLSDENWPDANDQADADARRLQAAKNIFDAEEMTS